MEKATSPFEPGGSRHQRHTEQRKKSKVIARDKRAVAAAFPTVCTAKAIHALILFVFAYLELRFVYPDISKT